MNQSKITVGELSVTLVSGSAQPRGAVILCHGFGAGGDDLVSLAREMVAADETLAEVAFLFPAAPIDMGQAMGFDSRAWWMIDIEKIQQLAEQGNFRELKNESPDELPQCNKMIREVIAYAAKEYSLPYSKIVIGGFSQGAMLTTDVALSLDEPIGGLIVWSGTLICQSRWDTLAGQQRFPICQCHGTMDPVLPFSGAVDLCTLFSDAGLEVEFTEFEGPHTIPTSGFGSAVKLVQKVLR